MTNNNLKQAPQYSLNQLKRHVAMIEAAMTPLSEWLNSHPKGPMGLTPDSIKNTPEWKQVNGQYKALHMQLGEANRYMVKHYKKELLKERLAIRAAKIAALSN